MANSNVNIASKLYAYIKHGVDIDQNIKQIYYNSMIFIGDEQQIYVPVMDTYVGIGTTAYNNTLDRITALEARIQEVAESLSQESVNRIFANYSWRDLDTTYNSYINQDSIQGSNFAANSYHAWQLNNEVTFKGINDYDPTTGFSRQITNPYVIYDANGHKYILNNDYSKTGNGIGPGLATAVDHQTSYDATDLYSKNAQPTSGITVEAHYGEMVKVYNPVSKQYVDRRLGNYISIDDKLTWSYMTSAYAYTLNYSTNYVNSEVERVYHNLLGDSEASYVMISFGSAVEDITAQFNQLTPVEQDNYDASHPGFITARGTYELITVSGSTPDPDNPEVNLVEEWSYETVAYDYVYKIKDQQYYYFAYNEAAGVDYASEHDHTAFYVPITAAELGRILDADETTVTNIASVETPFGQQGIPYAAEDPQTSTYQYDAHRIYIPASEVDYLPAAGQGFPQLYVLDTQYNSSYNMNIKDGIETLKEVAYLLDLLTDGRLGQTTYLTYSQFQAINESTTEDHEYDYVPWVWNPDIDNTGVAGYVVNEANGWSYANNVWTYTDSDNKSTTYDVVIPIGSQPNPDDIYAYYVITEDPENLGIQIAYSIAGNKKEIEDLHKHTDLIEEGKTTLRSIQSTNTNFVSVDLLGGTKHWTNTDSNQGEDNFGIEPSSTHPNYQTVDKRNENSYLVGDVNIKVSLATSATYTTTYTYGVEGRINSETGLYENPGAVSYTYLDPYNVYWFGSYTAADMNKLPSDFVAGTYFTATFYDADGHDRVWENGVATDERIAKEDSFYATFEPVTESDYLEAAKGDRYQLDTEEVTLYWKPYAEYAKNDDAQNLRYKSYTVKDYLALSSSAVLVEDGKVGTPDQEHPDGIFDLLTEDQHSVFLRTNTGKYLEYSTGTAGQAGSSQANFRTKYSAADNVALVNGELTDENKVSQLTKDSIIYIIDRSKIQAVEVHPVIGTQNNEVDNTLATTEWVDVYLTAKVDEITTALEDILEQAKQYTRTKISELDLDYKYSDFEKEDENGADGYWDHFLASINGVEGNYLIADGISYSYADIEKVGSHEYNIVHDIEKTRYEDRINSNHSYSVYTYYVDENDKGQYKLTYQLLSQYAYNTIEKDGIVKPETRELPSDNVVTKYRVWGDEQNGTVTVDGEDTVRLSHVYADVELAGADGEDTDLAHDELYGAQESLFMKLFKWFNEQTAGTQAGSAFDYSDDVFENQLFVADGTTYQLVTINDVLTSYRTANELAVDAAVPYADYTSYIFEDHINDFYYLKDSENNEYDTLAEYMDALATVRNADDTIGEKVHGNSVVEFDYANSNDKYWKQLYIQVPKYVEINLQKAKDDYAGTTTSNARDSLRIEIEEGVYYKLEAAENGTQGTKINVTKVDANDDPISGFTQTTLKYITTFATPKKQYLTVENKHFSYVDNGQGENQFEITAHITNIEDATENNTGFADAFDVQTYVKNFFSWVDVSASVTDDILNHSDLYYKNMTLDEYQEIVDAYEAEVGDEHSVVIPALYVRTAGNDSVEYGDGTGTAGTAVATINKAWYWKDDNSYFTAFGSEPNPTYVTVNLGTPAEPNNVQFNVADGLYYDSSDSLWKAIDDSVRGDHISNLNGEWFFGGFNANNTEAKYDPLSNDYYVRKEQPKINPLNLSITKYGNE